MAHGGKRCGHCGTHVPQDYNVCTGCGARYVPETNPTVLGWIIGGMVSFLFSLLIISVPAAIAIGIVVNYVGHASGFMPMLALILTFLVIIIAWIIVAFRMIRSGRRKATWVRTTLGRY